MKSFPLFGDDAKQDSVPNKIIAGAFGIPVELDSAPTTSGNELSRHGDNGFFNNKWYVNFFGTTYSITLTAV